MKKIDTGNPNFEKLIECNNIYVDKTKYLYNLLNDGGTYYFCCRPRRFGKTLTINTLEAIFNGKKELFNGLYIYSTDYDFKKYPIIHIDFGKCGATSGEEFSTWLVNKLDDIALGYNISLPKSAYYTKPDRLIIELSKKDSAVILIDEYDKMLSNNIYNPEVEKIRDILRSFFEVIKASYNNLNFFITGVTKYSKVSIFSSMNNLRDLSTSEQYALMFGYCQEELETYFAEYIEDGVNKTGLSKTEYLNRLKMKYDGYRFTNDGKTVYNPVSVGNFFVNEGKTFNNYWIETGNSKLLVDIAKRVNFNVDTSLNEPLSDDDITFFDIVDIASSSVNLMQYKSLLLQSGYLTIKKTEDEGHTLFLGYLSTEVKSAFASIMLNVYSNSQVNLNSIRLKNAFEERNIEKAMTIIKSYFSSISYSLTSASKEADYHLMLHCILLAIDADINVEVLTNKGRIDAVLKTKDTIYVIELKKDKSAEIALEQIKDKGYIEKYKAWESDNIKHEIHLLGINFSSEDKNISEWKEEVFN